MDHVIHEPRKCCKCCTSKVTIGVLICVGVLIVIPAACLLTVFEYIVGKQLVMVNGSEAFNDWQTPPVPIHMHLYLFNYTNIDDILLNHAKPSVVQLGPYTYREIRINSVLDYNEYNITYKQDYSYVYDESISCPTCSEDDVIVTPNIVAATLINAIVENVNSTSPLAEVVDIFLKGIHELTLFQNLTVKQIIWGYEDKLLTLVKDLEDILVSVGFKLPILPAKIALRSNGTGEADAIGNITLLTGKENIKDVQRIVKWRGLDYVPYWLTKYGRMINGSDGTHAPPFVSRDAPLYMFVTDLCRSLYARYEKDDTVMGIDVYRFHTTAELFANYSINPDNIAFCTKKRCYGSGILPMSACQGGPPIFMSAPHFYMADHEFVEAIDGMHPNETLHTTFIDLEPNTGIPVQASKRLQANVMVEKSFLSISAPLENQFNYLPILFLVEESVLDSKTANKLKDEVIRTKNIITYAQYGFLGLGGTLILYSIAMIVIYASDRHSKQAYAQFFDDREPKESIYQPS